MELKEVIRNRHSIRRFSNTKPQRKLIDELIYYANLAPSAGNLQARDFIIVDNATVQEQLSVAADQSFISEAPYTLVVCANLHRISSYGSRGQELYCIQDASAAVEHILLLAVDAGVDACWVGAFDEQQVSTILELPSHVRPVALIPLGYAAEHKVPTTRIDIKMLTHQNHW